MICRALFSLPLSVTRVRSAGAPSASPGRGRLTLVILAGLLVLGVSRAEAGMITWHWAGPVTGHSFVFGCAPGSDCGPRLDTVVPLGTPIDVFLSLDPLRPPPNSQSPCYRGTATASLQVLGRTYTSTAHVWDEAHGFGPGICVPGFDVVEMVVPFWGSGGPALPEGWVPFFLPELSGLWWGGDLTMVQPPSISSQFPAFYRPGQSSPQLFRANLQAVPADMHPVPEPATLTLFGAGLAAAWAARRRRRES